MTKIVLCGGHLTPALALIEELEKHKNLEIIFFGRKCATEGSKNLSAEYQVVTNKKIKFYTITTGRLQRKFTRYTLLSIFKIPVGLVQSLICLLFVRPQLVVSFGSYLSVPIVFCAWLLGIDSITHEQAEIAGLATKINSLFVKKIFLSWNKSLQLFSDAKAEVIGNLVRKSIFTTKAKSKTIDSFLKKSNNLIFITGGNQGSHFLNKIVMENPDLFKNFTLLHQVGTANYGGDLDKAKALKNPNYLAIDYLNSQDFGAVLNKAKIVISRSGANTVWELALYRKPSILIPLPISAGDEQLKNAQILADAGFAKIINQKNASLIMLKRAIDKILENYSTYIAAAQKFQNTLPKNAVSKLTKYILSYT